MGADEKFVREHWDLVHRCDGSYRGYPCNTVLVQDMNGHWFDFDSWSAAAEFTRNRLEEIRQVDEEIRLLKGYNKSNKSCSENSFSELRSREQHTTSFITVGRTIVRLQAALAELKRGMK